MMVAVIWGAAFMYRSSIWDKGMEQQNQFLMHQMGVNGFTELRHGAASDADVAGGNKKKFTHRCVIGKKTVREQAVIYNHVTLFEGTSYNIIHRSHTRTRSPEYETLRLLDNYIRSRCSLTAQPWLRVGLR
jgi:hypothetical protein